MDQQQAIVVDQAAGSSFLTRATNVFASPPELYREVAALPPRTSSWLIPLLLSIVLAILVVFSLYNNPTLRQQAYDVQLKELRKNVESGRMTQEQLDQYSERMESSGLGMFMLIGGGGAVVAIPVMFFGGALVLWLAVKVGMKFPGPYLKVLEVFSLASIIGLLGTIVTLLMMNLLDRLIAAPAASLLILESFDSGNIAHRLLAAVNVFSLWESAVLGIGLAKISGKSTGTGMAYSYGLWAIWAIVASLIGLGMA